MSILVTGGAGYIGSHTCVELLDAGFEVIVVDNFSNSKSVVLNRIESITGKPLKLYAIDLLHREALEGVFEVNAIEAVIHLAGLKAVGESVDNPLWYYKNNITGTLNLLEIMNKYKVNKMVFSSSATVYGASSSVPNSEDSPLKANNPYGRSKLMIEEILGDLYRSNPDWYISILRYFNPVGAHESGRIGEDPHGIPNNLMPHISRVAVGRSDRLSIFGSDYDTPDGTGVRDYIHVVDLAKGHLKALEKINRVSGINYYNLGTGRGHSVLEVIKMFESVTGRNIPYSLTNRRPGDIDKCYADPTKAKVELDWVARKTLSDMCRDAWRWQKNNPNGYEG
ncbi:UDP-glucose 4-epimerase GalE [Paenibacillus cymbidii]|uniref:UDP-glucose 4-epimerase GalE n=1 Tax=Paenibacillus cymbidii TaxID=1639034 RepID=UPI001081CAE4|nr:UDP-glucose 4-epimerase GalE [Paenibacillus cymbidii]